MTSQFTNYEHTDHEGYYICKMGDVLNDRYTVFKNQGRGVYSIVLRVRDVAENNIERVVKVIRNNEVMYKTGVKEIQHLKTSRALDPEGRNYCVNLFESFESRGHLCMVFEPMKCNLRELLKKIGAGSGFRLDAVQRYSLQLFKALAHVKKCRIIHCDIKPDNILVSDDMKMVKICDFGSALKPDEVEITPILGSRFYRAPEIMIGCMFGMPIDVWSLAGVLAEIFTGEILYKGRTNNQMLLYFQEHIGRYPVKVGRKGVFWGTHFDEQGDFTEDKVDIVTGFNVKIKHQFSQSSKLTEFLDPRGTYQRETEKNRAKFNHFKDLLLKMMNLDPTKRITPETALADHPFFARKRTKKKSAKEAAADKYKTFDKKQFIRNT